MEFTLQINLRLVFKHEGVSRILNFFPHQLADKEAVWLGRFTSARTRVEEPKEVKQQLAKTSIFQSCVWGIF